MSKTGRCVVSHEAPLTNGFAAEVTAEIQRECFGSLVAPVTRVTGYDTPFSLCHEPIYLPTSIRIYDELEQLVRYWG